MNPRPDFSTWLRQLRTARDLTQEALAEAVACASQTVRSFESGRRRPSREMAARLADILRLPPDERDTFLRLARAPFAAPKTPTPPTIADDVSATATHRHLHLPQSVDELIGRHHELARLRHTLIHEQQRFVTLLGPGGVGKTRLALQAARELAQHFTDSVAFVALASASDVAGVIAAISAAVGCPLFGVADPSVALVSFLRERALLLVLDNLEHLLAVEQADDTIALLSTILRAAPRVQLLITSRERLRLQDEQVVEIGGLGLPLDDQPTSIARSDAVLLFVERARRTTGEFALDTNNQMTVAKICRRLDGLPLALELAAAQISFLLPTNLLERLDQALPLLEGGARDLPARQRTMRATISWSHDLLPPDERRVFQRLGVMVGDFSLAAAEAVGAGEGVAAERVLGLLRRLVDRSLVVCEPFYEHDVRYRLLEPVRQYALEQLESHPSEATSARQRHAAFFQALAEQLGPQVCIPQDEGPFGRLLADIDQEHPNIRAAILWALAHQHIEAVARIGWAMCIFWWYRDQQREPRVWLEAVLTQRDQLAPRVYAQVLIALGAVVYRITPARCIQVGQAALALLDEDDDLYQQAYALMFIGLSRLQHGDLEGAEADLLHAHESAYRLDDVWLMNITANWLGAVLSYGGQYERATSYVHEALARAEINHDTWNLLMANLSSALLAHAQGDMLRCTDACRTMLAYGVRHIALANASAIAYALECLAIAAALQGAQARAARLLGASEALWEMGGKFAVPDQPLYTQTRATIRSQLVVPAIAAAWSEGHTLSVAQVIDYALEPVAGKIPERGTAEAAE